MDAGICSHSDMNISEDYQKYPNPFIRNHPSNNSFGVKNYSQDLLDALREKNRGEKRRRQSFLQLAILHMQL